MYIMKRKLLPVFIALLLILIIGGGAIGKVLYDKYSYSRDTVDLDEFYNVSGSESAIILQDEMVEEKALISGGICYFDLDTVHKYMNEVFYADMSENLLIYTTANDSIKTDMGTDVYSDSEGETDAGYILSFVENDTVYVAADYVKLFTNYSYDMYDRHVQVYTEWGEKNTAQINKETAVRERGGVKSSILRNLEKGETVEILEEMDNWSKIKTDDSFIGYVENKRLSDKQTQNEVPISDYTAPEYTTQSLGSKVNLGFHSIGGVGGNSTLDAMVSESNGINVIAPTWFSMNDNDGNIRNFGTVDYVSKAHSYGLKVWGVVDNFNYKNETGADIDVLAVLSSTTKREKLVKATVDAAKALGLDGINVDFEGLSSECGTHYVQFLRELSVQCRANGLTLSIDDYVPFNFNDYYRLDIQGEIADYVIIMGYDEHWHGSGDPGSVASIDYVSNGLDRTLNEVPAEKVINALPLYTILWKTEGSTVTDEYVTLNNVASLLSRINVEPVWDETTNQNYVEWNEGSAKYQMWIEDEKSISVKLNVMKAKEIGGVATWRLGYGTSGVWELLKLYISL
jgi:spore germination protein YaaH